MRMLFTVLSVPDDVSSRGLVEGLSTFPLGSHSVQATLLSELLSLAILHVATLSPYPLAAVQGRPKIGVRHLVGI